MSTRTFTGNTYRLLLFLVVIVLIIFVYFSVFHGKTMATIQNNEALEQWIEQLGVLGPLMVIGLLAVAIVMSPIPSAPIALVSGALYGHYEGTVYVVIGAEVGAICAFLVARILGVDMLDKWFGIKPEQGLLGSQNTLMGIVFISRLLPFISFDVISYAAGLTALHFWRFALATIAGIVPASFLLAHFGSELTSENNERVATTVLLLGFITIVPLVVRWVYHRLQKYRMNR